MQGKEKEFVWLDTIDGLDSWSLLDTGHVNTPMQIAVPPDGRCAHATDIAGTG